MISKVRAALGIGSADQAFEDAVHDYRHVYLRLTARLQELLGSRQLRESRVLDLGCGYTYPNVALLSAAGVSVCGADVESAFFLYRTRISGHGSSLRGGLLSLPRFAHRRGAEEAVPLR